jgi:hypothetical protein
MGRLVRRIRFVDGTRSLLVCIHAISQQEYNTFRREAILLTGPTSHYSLALTLDLQNEGFREVIDRNRLRPVELRRHLELELSYSLHHLDVHRRVLTYSSEITCLLADFTELFNQITWKPTVYYGR